MGSDLINLFPASIGKHIDVLVNKGRFGMCGGVARISDVKTGASTLPTGQCVDRFKITVPYAGQSIQWHVIFNYNHPADPPDFILSADEDFSPNINNLKSLLEWDVLNPNCLLQLTTELLQEYCQHQQHIISLCSMLHFEYTSLLDEQDGFRLTKDDIEVHMTHKSPNKIGPINFLIKLPVDFSKIPTYLTKDCPGNDSAVLLVIFQTAEGAHRLVTPQLYLSPRVEHCLGGTANLRIPGYPSGGILLDYVPNVCQLLQNKVDAIVTSYEKRQEYASAFLSHFGRSVLEHDAEAFMQISFLMEWHDFFFVISLELSADFPSEQPLLHLQSVYHQDEKGQPFTDTISGYPYSPRWSAEQMAERTRKYILDNISGFQRASVSHGTLH